VIGAVLACLVAAPAALAATGGTAYDEPKATQSQTQAQVDLPVAVIGLDGLAIAPVGAPIEVVEAIEAANRIVGKPYRYGGGHAKVEDRGYDCSGTVSYALIGAGLLKSPLDSRAFRRWGLAGRGTWITVYTNPSHAFAVIAGLRLDTSAAGDPTGAKGPRWRPALRSTKGFRARHPLGL
jgi:hypothetical protein